MWKCAAMRGESLVRYGGIFPRPAGAKGAVGPSTDFVDVFLKNAEKVKPEVRQACFKALQRNDELSVNSLPHNPKLGEKG